MTKYTTIANCDYESADDDSIHSARKLADKGQAPEALTDALDALEETLTEELTESGEYRHGAMSQGKCCAAESAVAKIVSLGKDDVSRWETVATYVSTYPSDDGEGACDVEVQIGETGGVWFVRSRDDAGGSDEADDTMYSTEDDAYEAAESLAAEQDESDGADNAEEYLRKATESRAGEPDTDGSWCVYWETALDDAGPRARYATRAQAEAAASLANDGLSKHNPGGNLLCGFEVRELVDGTWTLPEAE